MTDYTIQTQGLFGRNLDSSHLCISYDLTNTILPNRKLDVSQFAEITTKIRNITPPGLDGLIDIVSEKKLVKNENGVYVPIKQETSGYDEDQEHRLNLGLRNAVDFDIRCNHQRFFDISSRFIEHVGVEVTDWEISGVPIRLSQALDQFLRNYLGSKW